VKHSLPYLKRQLEILNPKVIMPLGGTAWKAVREIFKLALPEKITDVVNLLDAENVSKDETIIIPNFHPASHVPPKIQFEVWDKFKRFAEIAELADKIDP
ncbi:hypothetical protein GF357_02540, partial [Candidatus Dojkabacteria bacterium]|nr:hypothetical protein [Candidatus Dojkabacteria bacterium]